MRFVSKNNPLCDLQACLSISLSNMGSKMRVVGRLKWAKRMREYGEHMACSGTGSISKISDELPALKRGQDAVLVKSGEKDQNI